MFHLQFQLTMFNRNKFRCYESKSRWYYKCSSWHQSVANKLAGSIGNSLLSNSAITIDGTSVSLIGSITTTNTVDMGDGFVIEDGDGTEVTITENKEVKFVEGGGIDIN